MEHGYPPITVNIIPLEHYIAMLTLGLFFTENTGKLHVTNMKVPDPFIFGSSTDLYCNYTWDRSDLIKAPRKIYSIKWYKENLEFFRYVQTKKS